MPRYYIRMRVSDDNVLVRFCKALIGKQQIMFLTLDFKGTIHQLARVIEQGQLYYTGRDGIEYKVDECDVVELSQRYLY